MQTARPTPVYAMQQLHPQRLLSRTPWGGFWVLESNRIESTRFLFFPNRPSLLPCLWICPWMWPYHETEKVMDKQSVIYFFIPKKMFLYQWVCNFQVVNVSHNKVLTLNWRGWKLNHLLMAYSLGNICTKNYRNRTTIVNIIIGETPCISEQATKLRWRIAYSINKCGLGFIRFMVNLDSDWRGKSNVTVSSSRKMLTDSGWLHFLDHSMAETKDWDQTLIWPLNFCLSPVQRLA